MPSHRIEHIATGMTWAFSGITAAIETIGQAMPAELAREAPWFTITAAVFSFSTLLVKRHFDTAEKRIAAAREHQRAVDETARIATRTAEVRALTEAYQAGVPLDDGDVRLVVETGAAE